MSDMPIGRGWLVLSADKKKVGDVTEVHPRYLLVTRGVLLVKDMYMPLGMVDHTDATTVILTVTYDVLRKMDLSHEPAPVAPAETETQGDADQTQYDPFSYSPGATAPGETPTYADAWSGEANSYVDDTSYEETPSYTRPLPNGLIEVEQALNLAYADLGYGMPILLLQGWPFDSSIWEPLPYELAVNNRVVTFDMRGTGDSDKPWDYYSVGTLSNDMHRVVVEQTLHDVTLIAWSGAASLALYYAREHPRRIARIVLISPLLFGWLADEEVASWLGREPDLNREAQDAWGSQLVEDRPAFFERLINSLTHAPLGASRRHWMLQRLMHGAPHAQIKIFEVLRTDDPSDLLADIQIPITILHGVQDRISPPALAERLAAMLPRAQVVAIENCGHAPFLERRDVVLAAITDLVSAEPDPLNEDSVTFNEDDTDDIGEQRAELNAESIDSEMRQALFHDEAVGAVPETEPYTEYRPPEV